MSKHIVVMAVILLAMLLTACGGGEDPQTVFCTDLKALNDAIALTAVVGAADTSNQVIAIQTQLINSWSSLMSSAERLDDAEVTAVLDPANDAMDSVPVATQETPKPAAVASVNEQAKIASDAVAGVSHVCLGGG